MSTDERPLIDLVAGARPNFLKLAPVVTALAARDEVRSRIVHTGQHYDASMSAVFFEELGIPEPEVNLEVGSGSHGAQTARILERYEAHLMASPAQATVVFGDVNSTIACALAAVKLGVPVVHVEAGLRSFDRTMPEEVNRVLTDAVSDLLLVSEPSGLKHLETEGVAKEKVHLVGNTMIDTLLRRVPEARKRERAAKLGLEPGAFALLTLHRPANVDDPKILAGLMALFEELAREIPIVFPVHPRTKRALAALPGGFEVGQGSDLRLLEPQPYLDNLSLMADAKLILTDSGGMQEESAVLDVPCLTLRENTERPVTLEVGASRLVGADPVRIRSAFRAVMDGTWPSIERIPLWDGKAGERIAEALVALVRPPLGAD